MNLKNNELMVIDMLVGYFIGDLEFVANENNILQSILNDIVLKCMHASQFLFTI